MLVDLLSLEIAITFLVSFTVSDCLKQVYSSTRMENSFYFFVHCVCVINTMLAFWSVLLVHLAVSHSSPVEEGNSTLKSSARQGRQYNPLDNVVEPFASVIYKPASGYSYPTPIATLISQKQQQQSQFAHDNTLHIYLYQNKLSLYCATDTTYEKITWRKYACPNQVGTTPGEVIAVGPVVSNPILYGVNSFGRNEEYVSELLLKQPLTPQSDGAYICEGVFINDKYPYEASTTVRDIIIIGGKGMYTNCFGTISKYVANKLPNNSTRFGF